MNCIARRAAKQWKKQTGADAWWYVWTTGPRERYEPAPALRKPNAPFEIGGCWPCPGATHGADSPFLFETNDVDATDRRADLADHYQAFFRDFIYDLDPNIWKGDMLG